MDLPNAVVVTQPMSSPGGRNETADLNADNLNFERLTSSIVVQTDDLAAELM